MSDVERVPVRALVCLKPGYIQWELELPPLPPCTVRILDGAPAEVRLDLVPTDLRPLGSRFVAVYQPWGEVVAVERGPETPNQLWQSAAGEDRISSDHSSPVPPPLLS
jgi:hypothetical protein